MSATGGSAARVAELKRLRPGYTPEWPAEERGPGAALDQALGRYLATLDHRLASAADRQQLALLDLLGVSLIPAQAARAPVVFAVGADAVPGRVPPGTRLAADPPKQQATTVDPIAPPEKATTMPPGPISFETEQGIGLIAGPIAAAWSLWPGRDQAIDHLEALSSGLPFQPWNLADLDAMPHHLYIAHKTLLALSGTSSLKVRFELSQGGSEPLSALWEYWDGKVWRPFRNSSNLCDPGTPGLIDTTAGYRQSGAVTLVTDCAETKELELNGIKNFWIRTRLTEPVLPNADRILPDIEQIELTTILEHAISTISGPEIEGGFLPDKAVVDGIDVDLSKPFYPFGQQPKPGAAFYFTADELFGKPGARVELNFIRTVTPQDVPMPGSSGGDRFEPDVDWEYWNGNRWATLTITAESATGARSLDPGVDTIASPRAGEVTFVVPDDMEPVEVADLEARWMRVRLVSGAFGYSQKVEWTTGSSNSSQNEFTFVVPRPPALSDFKLGYRWEHGPFAPEAVLTWNDYRYRDVTDAAVWPGVTFKPFTPPSDLTPALYLGFDRSLPVDQLGFFLEIEEAIGNQAGPALVWEFWDGGAWRSLTVDDETRRLRKSGVISLIGPEGSRSLDRFGGPRHWLRARLGEDGPPGSPMIRQLLTNAVWAVQQQTVVDDPIGTSTGGPDQVYRFRQFPVLDGEQIEVREREGRRANSEWRIVAMELWPENRRVIAELEERIGREGTGTTVEYGALRLTRDRNKQVNEVWVRWECHDDLLLSKAGDRHYALDRATGRLTFGGGANVPPAGAPIIARRYRTGGGSLGNASAGAISKLLGAVAGVDGVLNPVPAGGGADGETIEAVRDRGPRTLQHRGRGVSASDLAALAREASPAIAMARALPARSADGRVRPGYVTIVLIPESVEPKPWPNFALCEHVRGFLADRAAATVVGLDRIDITGPNYRPIDVTATIVPRDASETGLVDQRIKAVIARFLHPLHGGPDGNGWSPGQDCWLSDLASALERVDGVDYARDLQLALDGQIAGERVSVGRDGVVVAGTIRVRMAGGAARAAR